MAKSCCEKKETELAQLRVKQGGVLNRGTVWRARAGFSKGVRLCSRNDIIANTGVLATSALVAYFQSGFPDILVGSAIAILFLKSVYEVLKETKLELRNNITPQIQS